MIWPNQQKGKIPIYYIFISIYFYTVCHSSISVGNAVSLTLVYFYIWSLVMGKIHLRPPQVSVLVLILLLNLFFASCKGKKDPPAPRSAGTPIVDAIIVKPQPITNHIEVNGTVV